MKDVRMKCGVRRGWEKRADTISSPAARWRALAYMLILSNLLHTFRGSYYPPHRKTDLEIRNHTLVRAESCPCLRAHLFKVLVHHSFLLSDSGGKGKGGKKKGSSFQTVSALHRVRRTQTPVVGRPSPEPLEHLPELML